MRDHTGERAAIDQAGCCEAVHDIIAAWLQDIGEAEAASTETYEATAARLTALGRVDEAELLQAAVERFYELAEQ